MNSIYFSCADCLPEKIHGFIGPYHPYNGHVYAGESVPESTSLHDALNFGTYAIISDSVYGNFLFADAIKHSCEKWNVNKVIGILRPPSENGFVNDPSDTLLWIPTKLSAMVQAAHRFSELSKIYPQIYGVSIDDFHHNYPNDGLNAAQLRDVKDALLGKYIDKSGNVHHASVATTPHLKFFICVYEWGLGSPDATVLELVDGVNFWIWSQNSRYTSFNSYINTVRSRYPGKEVIAGIYLKNSGSGYLSVTSINYIIDHSIDLYDEGDITELFIFSGYWMVMEYITRSRWDAMGFAS